MGIMHVVSVVVAVERVVGAAQSHLIVVFSPTPSLAIIYIATTSFDDTIVTITTTHVPVPTLI